MKKYRICKYVDCHCHLHEFTEIKIQEFLKEFTIVAVSDDEPSSLKTIRLSEMYDNVIPCVGVHPWVIDKVSSDEIERVLKLVDKVPCIGEVGLDTKFVPETIERQREVFEKFVKLAKEYDLVLNIHAAGTWKEVLEYLIKYDIDRALIHWYTGPINLLKEIEKLGYYISINPAIKIQEKHKKIVQIISINNLLVESDGPYNYRGLELEPILIKEYLIQEIAELKGLNPEIILEKVIENFRKLFKI